MANPVTTCCDMCGARFKGARLEAHGWRDQLGAAAAVCSPSCAEKFDTELGAPKRWQQALVSPQPLQRAS